MKLLNVVFLGATLGFGVIEEKSFSRFILIASNLPCNLTNEWKKKKPTQQQMLITDQSSDDIIQVITKIYSSKGKKGKMTIRCEMVIN